jgi:hypothetical protein
MPLEDIPEHVMGSQGTRRRGVWNFEEDEQLHSFLTTLGLRQQLRFLGQVRCRRWTLARGVVGVIAACRGGGLACGFAGSRQPGSGRRSGLSIFAQLRRMRFYADTGSYLRNGWRARMTATRVECSGTEHHRGDARYRDACCCALAGPDGALSSSGCGAVRQRGGFDAR